ncbi:MAG: hypothetical protein ACRDP6_14550 [Actinoallomurus sp.]
MTSEVSDLETAAARYQNATTEVDQARAKLQEEIVKAARSGTRQAQIVKVSGYTRERVRQICREAGIEPSP